MFPLPEAPKRQSQKNRLSEIETTTDILVYGSSNTELRGREESLDKLINKTLKTTVENQFGNTNKPLEYFSRSMLNALYSQTNRGRGKDKKTFEEVIKEYVGESQLDAQMISRVRYDNYRNIYSHIPAAHVALNIYKSSILSPESLTDEPINFTYETTDNNIANIVEKRVKDRVIEKYKLNHLIGDIVKESLIDGVSYRAIISIEQEISDIMKKNKTLTEDYLRGMDDNYNQIPIKFYDSEISKETTAAFNDAIQESVGQYLKLGKDYILRNPASEEKTIVEEYVKGLDKLVNKTNSDKSVDKVDYTGVEIGRFVRDLINENIEVKSKYDFMEDYISILNEGKYELDLPVLNEDGHIDSTKAKDKYYLNGSKIIPLEPEKMTPLRVGGITIGYIYAEKDQGGPANPTSVNQGVGGTANITMGAPVNFGANTYGTSGLGGGGGVTGGYGNSVTNPLSTFGSNQTNNSFIIDLFINGLGKKLNKNFIRNNKDLKDLMHELLREKYITQKKVSVTFFSSDDIVETRVKPLFEGSEYFAKLYLAELTNNITISLGRGMDRRMIQIPFGLDDDMYQTVNDAIRAFKTREFSMSSIDESTISNLIKNSPGRYEDMYVPIGPDGRAGYTIDILPGMDNSKSTELLPILKNQFLDSINIPANAIDSVAEVDFSRSIALRNVYFTKEIIDYQKYFNESMTQMIRKLYNDEYRFVGNKENTEGRVNIDNFVASFSKPHSLEVSTTLETMQNVEQFATMVVSVIVDLSDPNNALPAHKLKKKIYKERLSFLPWADWEKYYEKVKSETMIDGVRLKGKKGDPLVKDDDPNNFNPGFNY